MRISRILFLIFSVYFILISFVFGENIPPVKVEISGNSVLAGDFICSCVAYIGKGFISHDYVYEGIEGNSLRIKIQAFDTSSFERKDINALNLPLNSKKQALLKAEMGDTKKLILLTVIDDFGTLKAEEYKK